MQTEISDHRPIFVLRLLSKIIERIVLQQMRNFIENNNNKNQSGHQGQHSTLTSLFKFRDDIKKAMNKNKINGYCVQTN